MDPDWLRASGDRTLMAELLADPLVRRTNEEIAEHEKNGPLGTRRQLLATALRLTEGMSPELARITAECRAILGVEIPLETYVYPSSTFNAACVKPEQGRLFILLSSSLLEGFGGAELRFVLGHELGHYVFGHHDVPIGYLLQGEQPPSPELALKLFAWSRFAEVSADRAGAACSQDPDAVARALFRLASGLRGTAIELCIEDFAAQVDEMIVEEERAEGRITPPMQDWFSTHPFSPLRVKALHHFERSVLAREDGFDVETLEAKVQTLMALMEPSYLDANTEVAERMRRLLWAGAIVIAAASGGIRDEEVEAFERFFGEGSFRKGVDVDAIGAELEARVGEAREHVPPARRVQVLRDLCVIARADGHVDPAEVAVLREVAGGLGVGEALVDQTLGESLELD